MVTYVRKEWITIENHSSKFLFRGIIQTFRIDTSVIDLLWVCMYLKSSLSDKVHQSKLLLFFFLSEIDVHYYMCNCITSDTWNYPSNNTIIASIFKELRTFSNSKICLQ